MDFASLCDLELWRSHSSKAQDRLIEDLQGILRNEFTHQSTTEIAAGSGLRVPTFVHRTTGLEFNLIIGGVFDMGLSQGEEENARRIDNTARIELAQMRPVHKVRVSSFLMTKFPVLDLFARNHISIDPELFRPEFEGDDDTVPIYLSRSEVQNLTEAPGFSLPSEAQWECACRGATRTLFYFGNSLPDEETLESATLLSDFNDVSHNLNAANPFGLVGLSVGEWCEDTFQSDYSNARSDDLPVCDGPPYVVRGGAGSLPVFVS